jgi:hypothetical protein
VSLDEEIRSSGVTEIVHFTTNSGLIGILYAHAVKSRLRLPTEQHLEYVYEPNSAFRKDTPWLGYVNLSISRINKQFYDVCSGKWHVDEDRWWAVLSFDPQLLLDPGVLFVTTNNMYTGAVRGSGVAGFRQLFAPRVVRWNGYEVIRPSSLADKLTTCPQAEVLYPDELSTSYLRTIYVSTPEHADVIAGQLSVFPHEGVSVVVDPAFETIAR